MHGSDEERSVTLFDDDVDRMYRKISTSKNQKKKKKLVCFFFLLLSRSVFDLLFSFSVLYIPPS
ncbi:hypothetical protein GW17_00049803 [Ensete ventricosum]|nr:hypothetical protein GW17_00049803 [Ensete ventricosum]